MNMTDLKKLLLSHQGAFVQIYSSFESIESAVANGWKLSLQGKTVDDVIELATLLVPFLEQNELSFKLATQLLIDYKHPQQSHKLMTIYVPSTFDIKDIAETVYKLTKTYNGWHDIKTPESYEHYAGCVNFRNDRDDTGNYIPAN